MTQVFADAVKTVEESLKEPNNDDNVLRASRTLHELLQKQVMEDAGADSETCRKLAKSLFAFLFGLEGEICVAHKALFRVFADLLDFCGVSVVSELMMNVGDSLKSAISSSKIFSVENDEDLEFLRKKIFSYCSKILLYSLVALKGSREQQQEFIKELTTGKAIARISKPLRKSFLPQFQVKYSSKSDNLFIKESKSSARDFKVFDYQRLAVTQTARSVYRILSKCNSYEKLTIESIFSFLNLTASDYSEQPILIGICECLLNNSNVLRLEVSIPAQIISYSNSTVKVVEFLNRYILRAIRKSRISCREYHQNWLRLYAKCMFERNKDSFTSVLEGNELSSGEILNQLIDGKCSIQLSSIVHEIEDWEDLDTLSIYIGHFFRLICNYLASKKLNWAVLHHLLLLSFVQDDGTQKRQNSSSKRSFSFQLHSQLSCFELFLKTWKANFIQSLSQQSCLAIFHDIARLDSKIFEDLSPAVVDRLALLFGSCASIVKLLEVDTHNKALTELRARIIQKCLVFRSTNLRYSSCNYLAACGALDPGLRESLITELLQLLKISDLELYSPSNKRLSSLEFRQLYGLLLSRILGYSAGITCLLLEEKDELGLPGGLLGQIFSDAIALLRPNLISKVSLPQTAEAIRRRAGWVLIASLMKTRVSRFLESSHLTRLLRLWQTELSLLRNNIESTKTPLISTNSQKPQVEFSAQEASLAAARLASLSALYYLLRAIDSRERPANFDNIISVLISACAIRVAEVWQALQRDDNSTRTLSNVKRMFSLVEVFWLSRCALLFHHNELSVDTCLRVSLALVHSYGRRVTPEVVEDSEECTDYFQLISFFGSLGAELPKQSSQFETAVDCSAKLLTAERGKHPVWIELSFPISSKDYTLSPLIGSKFGYTYASEFRIQKQALDGWCLSRLQASLWVALDVCLFQRLEDRQLSPWNVCFEEQEMAATIFYLSKAFIELAKNGDAQLRHEFVINLYRLSQEKASNSSSFPSLYEVWRGCICVMCLSLLCSDENISVGEADMLLAKEAIYSALESSHITSQLAGIFAAMEAASVFLPEPEKFLPKMYMVWKGGKEDSLPSHLRVAVYRWMDLFSASFWHAHHFMDGDCVLSICTLKILNEFIRNWFPTWITEDSNEMLDICEVILWNCSRWNCPILNSLLLDICSWIWNWMETNPSIDIVSKKRTLNVIPFKDETSILTSVVNLLESLRNQSRNNCSFILKHTTETLSLMCECVDSLNVLRNFPSLPYLLIDIMDRYKDFAVHLSFLLKKLSLKGPCDFWFTIFFRSFRGGSKQVVPLEKSGREMKNENGAQSEDALESGLVGENDKREFWQLKGRTRDLLMNCACSILMEGNVPLDFFLYNSIQLILSSCQSLRMESIIESFKLVRVMRQKLATDNEIPSQGALLQLFSSIRSILNPQHHPMIVVAAAQAAVEIGLWNSFVDDELIDMIVPREKNNQLPNYWQYERWSEPVGVVTLFAMLRFASEWYYNQSLSSSANMSCHSNTDLRPYVLAVIGDLSFVVSGYSWMFEKWGCSIGSDGVYRDKLSEIFWKDGTSFIRNMILVQKLRLLEYSDQVSVSWKQINSPGVQLAEKIQDQNKKKELILSIHLAWLKHLVDECPGSQETQQFINCFESNLMLSFLYHLEDHCFLSIIWHYLLERGPRITLQVFHSVIRSVCDESILVELESHIVHSFCWLSSSCRMALFGDDTCRVLGSQSYLKYRILVSPIQLVDETILSNFQLLRNCILQMFLMGTCGYFHCLSLYLRTERMLEHSDSYVDEWLAQFDTEALSSFWEESFQVTSKWVETDLANQSFQYCLGELLALKSVSSMVKPCILEKLVTLLYAMVKYLPLENMAVKSAFAQICSDVDKSDHVSYNWLALVILPGIELFSHESPDLLAQLWTIGWRYLDRDMDAFGFQDSRDRRLAWIRIYLHLMGISNSKSDKKETILHRKYFEALIIQIAIDIILTCSSEENDEKMYSLESDLLQLAKKKETVFRKVVNALQQNDRIALQKLLRHATK